MNSKIFLAFISFISIASTSDVIELESLETEDHHSGVSDYFQLLVQVTNSADEGGLDSAALDYLLTELNVNKCVTADSLLEDKTIITGNEMISVAAAICLYLQNKNCNVLSSVNVESGLCHSDLNEILTRATRYNKWKVEKELTCFSASSLMPSGQCLPSNTPENNASITQVMSHMFVSILEGHCYRPTTVNDRIMMLIDTNQDGNLNSSELTTMLDLFSVGGVTGHEDHDEEDHEDHDHENDENNKCLNPDDYLKIAGSNATSNGQQFIERDDLDSLFTVIVEQVVSKSCTDDYTESAPVDKKAVAYTTAQKWGYAVAADTIISLLAFGGLIFFKNTGSPAFNLAVQYFIGLGVGTLSGDALLHLLPEILGLHKHEVETDKDHVHDESEEDMSYVWKLLVIVGGIYLFFLFENLLRLWNTVKGTNIAFHHHEHGNGHGHTHAAVKFEQSSDNPVFDDEVKYEIQEKPNNTNNSHRRFGRGDSQCAIIDENETPDAAVVDGSNGAPNNNNSYSAGQLKSDAAHQASSGTKNVEVFWGLNAVAFMVFFGDILHNLGDGLAIGVAFSTSWVSGVGTSIAIFCHELPHEYADFAIYIKNGATKWKALALNFLAACASFIGLFIGLAVGDNSGASQWLLAVIAGMFLYISLVDIMQEMTSNQPEHPIKEFIIQNIGLLSGWSVMLLLALFENVLISSIG